MDLGSLLKSFFSSWEDSSEEIAGAGTAPTGDAALAERAMPSFSTVMD